MTDAMPERVLMVPDGASGSSGHYYAATGRGTGIAIYVPEQRALDAERGMGMAAQECIIRDGIIAALRAEVKPTEAGDDMMPEKRDSWWDVPPDPVAEANIARARFEARQSTPLSRAEAEAMVGAHKQAVLTMARGPANTDEEYAAFMRPVDEAAAALLAALTQGREG